MKRMIQGLLLAGSLVVGGAALAQSAQGTTPGTTQGGAAQGTTPGQTMQASKPTPKGGMIEHMGFMVPADEKAFLERLHHINQMEIQVGKLAQQNGQSQDVKSYGEMLVTDHSAADEKLMAYAQGKKLKLGSPKPLNEVERKAMAAQKAAVEKLQALKGQPFDADFLAHMVGDHDMALGKVMAAQQHFTSAELSPLLQQVTQSVSRHRQQAHTLLGRIGPGATMGVGGAGDMNKHMGHGTGAGGAGDTGKGHMSPSDKNTMDPGTQKKF
jgi:putative membrane protein